MIDHPLAPASFPPMGQGGDGEDVADAFVQGYVDLLDDIASQPGGQHYRDLAAMSVVDGDAGPEPRRRHGVVQPGRDRAHGRDHHRRWPGPGPRRWSSSTGFPGSEGQSFDLIDLGDFMKHLTGVPDDVAVARDAVSRRARPGGHRAGDRSGHPAGDRHQRLPAGATRARSTRPSSPTAPSRRVGPSSSRRSSPARRARPGRRWRGAVRLAAGADPAGRRVRHQDRRPSSPTGRAPTSPARRPTSSPSSAASSSALGADPAGLPRRGRSGTGAGRLELRR